MATSPYRENARLGRCLSEHRMSGKGARGLLGGCVVGVVGVVGLGWFGLTQGSPKTTLGAVLLGFLTLYFFLEWWRIRSIRLSLHEGGLVYRSRQAGEVTLAWDEVAALEARYVPGLLREGASSEGNRVSLLVSSASGLVIDLPKELEGFAQLGALIEQSSGVPLKRVVVANLTQR